MFIISTSRYVVLALSMLACSSVAFAAEQVAQVSQASDARTVSYSIRVTPPHRTQASTFTVSAAPGTSAAFRTGESVAFRQACEQGKTTMGAVDTGLRFSIETIGVMGTQVRTNIGAQLDTLTGMRSARSEGCEIDLPDTKNIAGGSQMVLSDSKPVTIDLGEIGSIEVTARISPNMEGPVAKPIPAGPTQGTWKSVSSTALTN